MEPDEPRGSRQVLREPGGAIPPATHLVAGSEHLGDAKQFLADLRQRLGRLGLELNSDMTRLVQFGRFQPSDGRAWLGQAGNV